MHRHFKLDQLNRFVFRFVLEYGWDINLSTLEGSFKQVPIYLKKIWTKFLALSIILKVILIAKIWSNL